MSRPLVLTLEQWADLHSRLARDHSPSVLILRSRMRSVLGFTVRRHRSWRRDPDFGHRYAHEVIHLDFYDQPKRTLFLLKYGEYLS
jgi:hypothetical protein